VPNLFWLNCNSCCAPILLPDGGARPMFLVSCGCIYCQQCAQSCAANGCRTCGAGPGSVLPIGRSLPPHVMEMFNGISESLVKLDRRLKFQSRHYDRSVKLVMKQRKEVEAKLEMERRAAEDRQRELQSLKEQIRMKRASIQRLDEAFSGSKGAGGSLYQDQSIGGGRSSVMAREGSGRAGQKFVTSSMMSSPVVSRQVGDSRTREIQLGSNLNKTHRLF